jgi:hypothetical protein
MLASLPSGTARWAALLSIAVLAQTLAPLPRPAGPSAARADKARLRTEMPGLDAKARARRRAQDFKDLKKVFKDNTVSICCANNYLVKKVKLVEVVEIFGRDYLRVRTDSALALERLIRVDDISAIEAREP